MLRVMGACLIAVLVISNGSHAQSVSVDEPNPPQPAPRTAAAAPSATRLEQIALPIAISTAVAYPEGASGQHEVLLAIMISKEGKVVEATTLKGDPPFATQATEAAKNWTFHAATRDGRPMAAKIQFLVKFVPPADESPTPDHEAPSPLAPKTSRVPKRGEPEEYQVLVRGERAPLRHQLGQAEIRVLPGAFGDPYRAIEALPGVVPIVSGLPYFYVRGAPPGNVGYFFDGVPVPYLYHFAAGPGVLHPAFVDRVDLYPGAYPVRYGRFAGAIVAGEMAPPGNRFRGEASIRLVDSGAMMEAPFAEGRGSVMVGGRYSYTGLVVSLTVPNITLNYWDYQARSRYAIDSRNSLEVLVFGSGDFLSQKETVYESVPSASGNSTDYPVMRTTTRENTIFDVGFHRADFRWDHRLTRGNWRNAFTLGLDKTGADNGNVHVTNQLLGFRSEYQQHNEAGTEFRAGADFLFENLGQRIDTNNSTGSSSNAAPVDPTSPNAGYVTSETVTTTSNNETRDFGFDRTRKDLTMGTWADVVVDVARNVQITPGLRVDLYNSGNRVAAGVDPRITARYQVSKPIAVVHGLGLVHQAPSFVVPIPGLKPSLAGGLQTAVQHSAGVNFALPAGFSGSTTLFHNVFFHMTDFISLAQLQNTTGKTETDMRTLGHAYGAEVMVRRSLARNLGGFVSYTLSRSYRSAGRLEGPATTDRTHVLNVAASYNLGRNWRLGGRWLYYSGIPTHVAFVEAAQSPPRTPPFWRIDFKLQKRWYINAPNAWWGLVLEVLNTTLNKEVLNGSCNAYRCQYESIGPVTIPSIGVEGAL